MKYFAAIIVFIYVSLAVWLVADIIGQSWQEKIHIIEKQNQRIAFLENRLSGATLDNSFLDIFRLWHERLCGEYSHALSDDLWYVCRDYPYEYDSFHEYCDANINACTQ